MKLLYCKKCGSIFNLDKVSKSCACGHAQGMYVDSLDAIYCGAQAVPLGLNNREFALHIGKKRIKNPFRKTKKEYKVIIAQR